MMWPAAVLKLRPGCRPSEIATTSPVAEISLMVISRLRCVELGGNQCCTLACQSMATD